MREDAIPIIMKYDLLDFQLGTADCFTLCSEVIEAVTGIPFYPEARGKYKTEKGALSQLTKRGFSSLEDAFEIRFRPIAPGAGILGDVAIVQTERGPAGAVHDGAHWRVPLVKGLYRVPLEQVSRAFMVI